jgi:uncharacterized membrane protein YbhN (UPF0104 family)
MRTAISLLVKLAVSGLLLYFALDLVNISTVRARLGQVDAAWIALELVVLTLQVGILAVRWRMITVHCGANLSLVQALRLSIIAAFFNQTLPSSVGGDAARIWFVGKQAGWRIATYSVFLDRVIGVFALSLVVVACLPWTFALVKSPVGRIALLVIGLGGVAGGAFFAVLGWDGLRIMQRWSPTRHLAAAARVTLDIVRSARSFVAIMALSILMHLFSALAAWCAARSIGAEVSLLYCLFLVLPVMLISVVPVSIAGWGVRESAMIVAFSYAGLPESYGLLVSLLLGAGLLVLGIAGGAVWILTTDRKERNAIAAGKH